MMKKLILLALLSLSMTASAEIFKCVQANGEVGFQSTPCDELSIEELINLPSTSAGISIISEEEIQQHGLYSDTEDNMKALNEQKKALKEQTIKP